MQISRPNKQANWIHHKSCREVSLKRFGQKDTLHGGGGFIRAATK